MCTVNSDKRPFCCFLAEVLRQYLTLTIDDLEHLKTVNPCSYYPHARYLVTCVCICITHIRPFDTQPMSLSAALERSDFTALFTR